MSERSLWISAFRLLDLIDFKSPSYYPGKLSDNASELRSVLLELRDRGVQLPLFPTAS